jgi:uncharacterized metal-binding protein
MKDEGMDAPGASKSGPPTKAGPPTRGPAVASDAPDAPDAPVAPHPPGAPDAPDAPDAGRVVIVPCSGIGKAFGSVGREAAYIVTEDLRPGESRTLCLSLLTMGDERARQLVREHPTITVDGCPKACARVNVEQSGGTPAAAYRVFDVFRAHKELRVDGVSDIGENGERMAEILAAEIANAVDALRNGGR